MLVKKSKLNAQTGSYDLIKEIANVTEDKVFVEMAMDIPYEQQPGYLYEAGQMIGDKFDAEFIWHSENPNLFD